MTVAHPWPGLSGVKPIQSVIETYTHYVDAFLKTRRPVRSLSHSRRRDCHFTGKPSPPILKHLLKREGGAAEWLSRRRLLSHRRSGLQVSAAETPEVTKLCKYVLLNQTVVQQTVALGVRPPPRPSAGCPLKTPLLTLISTRFKTGVLVEWPDHCSPGHPPLHSVGSPPNCLDKALSVRTGRLRGLYAKIRGPYHDKSDRVASPSALCCADL